MRCKFRHGVFACGIFPVRGTYVGVVIDEWLFGTGAAEQFTGEKLEIDGGHKNGDQHPSPVKLADYLPTLTKVCSGPSDTLRQGIPFAGRRTHQRGRQAKGVDLGRNGYFFDHLWFASTVRALNQHRGNPALEAVTAGALVAVSFLGSGEVIRDV
jgi:hypothetical protein